MRSIITTITLSLLCLFSQAQNVGIGTTTPIALLHVADSNVVFTGPAIVPATTTYNPPIEGPGSRMMWYPQKSAFRAGYVDGTQWDKDNIGSFSTAIGISTIASGGGSFASGNYSIASGIGSTAIGYGAKASGDNSTAIGYGSNTTGNYAFASGSGGISASGDYSTAIGFGALSKSYAETAIGAYNTDYTPFSSTSWNATDRLFVIGNGSSFFAKSDAIVVLKNGNTGIGTSLPNAPLQFATSNQKRKIVLFETANNDNQFFGFGVFGGELRYQTGVNTNDHVFYSAASSVASNELMRIKGNGNVGIGTSLPNAQLQFSNTTANRKIVFYEAANNDHQFNGFGLNPGVLRYQVNNTGDDHVFYAGTSSATSNELFRVKGNGNATLAGTLTQNSDARLKANILPLSSSLKNLQKLNGYTYNWKDKTKDNDLQIGLLAQEVQKIFPELVKQDANGGLSVNYIGLIPVLIEGLKEQQQQINQQQQQIDELKNLVNRLISK